MIKKSLYVERDIDGLQRGFMNPGATTALHKAWKKRFAQTIILKTDDEKYVKEVDFESRVIQLINSQRDNGDHDEIDMVEHCRFVDTALRLLRTLPSHIRRQSFRNIQKKFDMFKEEDVKLYESNDMTTLEDMLNAIILSRKRRNRLAKQKNLPSYLAFFDFQALKNVGEKTAHKMIKSKVDSLNVLRELPQGLRENLLSNGAFPNDEAIDDCVDKAKKMQSWDNISDEFGSK